jgi:NTF2 fold immunity protein
MCPPLVTFQISETAVAIATAILAPIYGRSTIDAEKPWHTGLKGGVWTVVGTFNGKAGGGGEGMVQLDKKTGAIVFVGHTMKTRTHP